ncbi:MAG: ATP-binding protein, partial [Anaerolineales bacterium]
DLTGDLFVDRHDELNKFWQWATTVPHSPLGRSYALVGRRRTGKTAILIKLFNRLFYEQEKVLPVFISFARYLHLRQPLTMEEVGARYLSAYISCFLAFRYHRPELVQAGLNMERLRPIAEKFNDPIINELIEGYDLSSNSRMSQTIAQMAINTPHVVARLNNIPTIVIVDEFQVLTDVRDPKQGVSHDLTDSFQAAVETHWAPMLVSGSAVSLLVGQALGGLLSGRFKYWYLKPLPREYAHDLMFRAGEASGTAVTEELAEAVWQLTGGYPYAIHSLVNSDCPARRRLPALDALEEVMTFELTDPRGELWQHYREEFGKYSQQLNAGKVTRQVMLWTTRYPDRYIDAEEVAQELGVDVSAVRAALEKLRWVDVVEKMGLISYQGPNDPMLRRYIEYQHYTEIERLSPAEVVKDWQEEYRRLRGHLNNFIGEVAEVYVGAVMRAFAGQVVEGTQYFNHPEPVTLPVFEKVERRGGVVKAGVPLEMDLIGEWTLPDGARAVWLVQVRYRKAPADATDTTHFLTQTDALINEQDYAAVTRWYFCKQGYTAGVAQALQDAGILYSDHDQFNALAKLVGFFGLPG